MPTITLDGPHSIDHYDPIWNLSKHFVDGEYDEYAIPDAWWELWNLTTVHQEAQGFLVTLAGGVCWHIPPPDLSECTASGGPGRLYPFGTLVVAEPDTPQVGNGPNGTAPFVPMFNYDTKVVIHPDAGSSDPVHDPYSLRLDLHYGEVICWQLSYLLDDGRLRVLNGPGRHPSVIAVPEPNVDPSSCVLVEDGEVISRRRYRVAPGETER